MKLSKMQPCRKQTTKLMKSVASYFWDQRAKFTITSQVWKKKHQKTTKKLRNLSRTTFLSPLCRIITDSHITPFVKDRFECFPLILYLLCQDYRVRAGYQTVLFSMAINNCQLFFLTSLFTRCDYSAYEWLEKRLQLSLESSTLCPAAPAGWARSSATQVGLLNHLVTSVLFLCPAFKCKVQGIWEVKQRLNDPQNKVLEIQVPPNFL